MSEQRNVFCLNMFQPYNVLYDIKGGGNSSILINLHDTEEEKYEPENEKYRFYSFLSAQ